MTFDPQRFVAAQDRVWPAVLAELGAGAKRTHWMWLVSPQLAGLGHSDTARFYALASLDQARAYLAHPTLGPRLRHTTALVMRASGSAHDIFASPDDLKFRSCMTLFARANGRADFSAALVRFFDGKPDPTTLALLA